MQDSSTTLNLEDLSHKAANEALSISMGVHVLTTLSTSNLSAQQTTALQLLEESATRLLDLIDEIRERSGS